MNIGAIPETLRERDQWLLWDASADTPRRPHWDGDFRISWSDPETWHSFAEAVATAEKRDSWGVGYVCAANNDDHPTGCISVLDIDGGADADDKPKDWLPSLEPFGDRDAYLEWSASHPEPGDSGIHIPMAGTPPQWWRDVQLDDHEGVDVLANKFCVFTGDRMDGISGDSVPKWDTWTNEWLADAYEALTGETAEPRQSDGAPTSGGGETYEDDGEWLDEETVAEALDHINASCGYTKWRNIGFGLADHFGERTAKRLFDKWSRGGSKYDDDAERLIEDIAGRGSGDVTIGTVVHHAKQAGWQPSNKTSKELDAIAEANEQPPANAPSEPEEAHTDGGAAVDGSSETQHSPRALEERIRSAIAAAEGDDIQQKTARHRIAAAIADEHYFVYPEDEVRGWRSTLYVYNDDEGVYEPRGEAFIEQIIERHAGDYITNQVTNEIVGKIKRRSIERGDAFTPDPARLVVGNGILDLRDGELDSWTPQEYHRTKIDIDWNPNAGEPEAVDEFFGEIVEGSDKQTLYRLIAHTLFKEYVGEKAAMLIGSGENGKSVFLNFVEQFIGEFNVSHRALQDFDDNRFAANQLEGKLANIHPDMGDESVKDMSTFKKLTGRDTMTADVKYESPITFENYATLMFAANEMPVFSEDNHAIWRRWLYIDFPYTFDEDDPEAKDPEAKRVLMDRLTEERELEALLVRCQEEIQQWYGGREWYPDAMKPDEVRERMKRAAEPVYDFAMTCLNPVDDEDVWIPKEDVRTAYREYATENQLPKMGAEKFGQQLLSMADLQIESGRPRDQNGNRPHAYIGVSWTDRGRQLLGLDEPGAEDDQVTVDDSAIDDTRKTIYSIVEDLQDQSEDSSAKVDMVVGRAMAEMSKASAERAIDSLLSSGELYRPQSGRVRTQ